MKSTVGIAGASIAGLACAVELQRLGLTVTVFEKSNGDARQNGAGMMLPLELVRTLSERNLIGEDFKGVVINEFTTFIAQPNKQQVFLTTTPLQGMCVHWKSLYDALRKNLDQSHCRYNCALTRIVRHKTHVELLINDDEEVSVDYLICADGYDSLGRKTIFPAIAPEFANYIAWRGVIQLDDNILTKLHGHPYNQEYYRYLYENGHLLIYPLPDAAGKKVAGQHLLNWVLYEKLTPSHSLFKDNRSLAEQSFAPGTLPKAHIDYLEQLVNHYLPEFPRELIKKTEHPFVQAIFDVFVPAYIADRVSLAGDASVLFRPHIGSNATKALKDAIALSDCLANELAQSIPKIDLAFKKWNEHQHHQAKQLFPLSRELGKLLVTEVPTLATLTKERMDELWHQTVSKYEWYGNNRLKK